MCNSELEPAGLSTRPHTSTGTQFVVFGRYINGTFTNTSAPQPVDYSKTVIFGSMQCSVGRCLHIAWSGATNSLTVPRELTYVFSAAAGARMLSSPVTELASLRKASLGSRTALVAPNQPLSAFDAGVLSTAFDLEATLLLPPNGSALVAILASSPTSAELFLQINSTTPLSASYLTYSVSVGVPFATNANFNTTLAFNVSLDEVGEAPQATVAPFPVGRAPLPDQTALPLFPTGSQGPQVACPRGPQPRRDLPRGRARRCEHACPRAGQAAVQRRRLLCHTNERVHGNCGGVGDGLWLGTLKAEGLETDSR